MRYLLDSNILVYMVDERFPEKRQRAFEVYERAAARDVYCSTQALGEFANVAFYKLQPVRAPDYISEFILAVLDAATIVPVTPIIVLEAVRGVRDYQFSYYDAQIWAAAKLNQVPVVLSEDFSDGATIEGVTFVNPFAEDFDPGAL